MIRRLVPGDGPIFRAIRLEALREDPAAFASSLADWDRLPAAEWDRRLTANPVFVSLDGAEPVGITGLIAESASKMAHRATLVMVYVRRSHRRQGRAEALLDAALAHADAAGFGQLELAVAVENPDAIRFYRRMGFVPIAASPPAFAMKAARSTSC